MARSPSEPPPSGPVSGFAAPNLFRGDAGPGFWLRNDDRKVLLSFPSLPLPDSRVVRLSPTGAWFEPYLSATYPEEVPVEIALRVAGEEVGILWGRVLMPPEQVDDPTFGVAFTGLTRTVAQRIVGLLRELSVSGEARLAHRPQRVQEEIRDPKRIRAIVRALAGNVSVGAPPGRPEEQLALVIFEEPQGLLYWQGNLLGDAPDLTVEVTGYNSVYRLHFHNVRRGDDGQVVTPLPTRIVRTRQRKHRRGPTPQNLFVNFYHPLWPKLAEITRPVRDVSFGGISFETSVDDDLLFPGMTIPVLEVQGESAQRVLLQGEVRGIATGTDTVARVAVAPRTAHDELLWSQLVAKALHPTTEIGAEWAESAWALFEDSGYFHLSGKHPDEFEDLRASYLAVSERGARAPRIYAKCVFPSERGVEGSISIMKVYERAWLLHQVAKRRGTGDRGSHRQVLRDLYVRAFEHAQTDRRTRWILGYFEASVPWNQRTHFAFAERHKGTGLTTCLPFRLMEVTTEDVRLRVPQVAEVGTATPAELEVLLDRIQRVRPPSYVEALDLDAASALLPEITAVWRREGLLRERAVFIARRHGTAVAGAIVECGDTGTNLFRLTDCLRLVPLTADGEAALPALLSTAREWFGCRNKRAFVYFREGENPGPRELARMRDLHEGRLWIIGLDLLPEFLEHLFESTSPRRMTTAEAEAPAPGLP